ncbi:hypothetical protein VIGAN_11017400 [Vigna angularis var. angularis]|uniref:Subtilisin-like protease fibronectin type-III domain-containing protein n=1 Tax=Vigna angularis var. angularis TaxID=157739 RepID=A0A0S3T6Y9_PHAAN|nr:hypothetical protein VIGAN_11017400 [Vigna angularis var. angularis]
MMVFPVPFVSSPKSVSALPKPSLKRTVTNVGDGAATYRAKVTEPKGSVLTMSPETLSFRYKNEKLRYNVLIKYSKYKKENISYGDLVWIDDGGTHTVRSPIVMAPRNPKTLAAVTGFLCSLSFHESSGAVIPSALHPHSSVLGWFSTRRRSALRPSMCEFSVTSSLSSLSQFSTSIDNSNPNLKSNSAEQPSLFPPRVFLLLASPLFDNAHSSHAPTHEYNAFQFRTGVNGSSPVPSTARQQRGGSDSDVVDAAGREQQRGNNGDVQRRGNGWMAAPAMVFGDQTR